MMQYFQVLNSKEEVSYEPEDDNPINQTLKRGIKEPLRNQCI